METLCMAVPGKKAGSTIWAAMMLIAMGLPNSPLWAGTSDNRYPDSFEITPQMKTGIYSVKLQVFKSWEE